MSKPLYKLYLAGLEYRFHDKKSLSDFAENIFAYCINRRELYEFIVCDTLDQVLQFGTDLNTQEESLAMLRALHVLDEAYGRIYDPDKEIFKVVKDDRSLLQTHN